MPKSSHRHFFASMLSICSVGAWANSYIITDLGHGEYPTGVNKAGDAALNSGGRSSRGQVFRNGKLRNLTPHSAIYAINRSDDTVGYDTKTKVAVLWPRKSAPIIIQGPVGSSSEVAYGVNDNDTVVGNYLFEGQGQCFVWTAAQGFVNFSSSSTNDCQAAGLNKSNQITGSYVNSDGNLVAFFWSQGKFTSLGTLQGTIYSEGTAINEQGAIVGASYISSMEEPKGFIWNGILTALDPEGIYASNLPLAINRSSEAVGWVRRNVEKGDPIAVRFSHSKIILLGGEVTNGGGWELQTATSINDKGVIVGQGLFNNSFHGFMLTPQ